MFYSIYDTAEYISDKILGDVDGRRVLQAIKVDEKL
jgi:hypothetical protein